MNTIGAVNASSAAIPERKMEERAAPARAQVAPAEETVERAQSQNGAEERVDQYVATRIPVRNTLYAVADIKQDAAPVITDRVTITGEEISRKLVDIPLAVNRKHLTIYQMEAE